VEPTTVITLVTDPIDDVASRRVVASLGGFVDVHGSPVVDGTPTGSRSVFRLDDGELRTGGIVARLQALSDVGIAVHRVIGEHPAVRAANQRLGYCL
jgi:hypothetical protein